MCAGGVLEEAGGGMNMRKDSEEIRWRYETGGTEGSVTLFGVRIFDYFAAGEFSSCVWGFYVPDVP